jgi:GT2 family glycosyltransferase
VPAPAAIAVPTRARAGYLDVALASLAPQAAAAGAEIVVVLDGPDPGSARVAERHGARVVAHDRPLGLNAARNTAIDATAGELICFVDDDVEVRPGWLEALLRAAAAEPDVDVFTGPIFPRFEDHAFRACGREGPPITFLDLGPDDADAPHAWGANMAIRRRAFDAVGRFDAARELYGDEQEWQDRLRAGPRPRIRYVAAAALDHRRAGDDARLRHVMLAAYRRGLPSRRFDVFKGTQPTLAAELRTLAGTLAHGPRFGCMNGPVLAAHSLGRLRAALAPAPDPAAPDYLSGHSGTVGGRRRALRAAGDGVLDALAAPARARLAVAARRAPARRVLVLGIVREENAPRWRATERGLRASRHHVEIATAPTGDRGKFENLNALLAGHPAAAHDWLLVVDDDVTLPRGFLDAFLVAAERVGLRLAQPAHRLTSHAAWRVTRRRPFSLVRETAFVEIGPVTALHRDTFAALLPFPPLRMGWGLDAHWGAVARDRGWRLGVVDATPVAHSTAPAGAAYAREPAEREAAAFLDGRPYVTRDQAERTLATRRWV